MSIETAGVSAQDSGIGNIRDDAMRDLRSADGTLRRNDTGWSLAKIAAAASSAISIIWAAYTFADQQVEQRRQNLITSFHLMEGDTGNNVISSVNESIAPLDRLEDGEWVEFRKLADAVAIASSAATDRTTDSTPSESDRDGAITKMQDWILANVLVKGGKHDSQIHNYQFALSQLNFLYQYAQADPCNAVVVSLKFQKYASDFFYYYPGSFDLSGTAITAKTIPEPAQKIAEPTWLEENERNCGLRLKSIPQQAMARLGLDLPQR